MSSIDISARNALRPTPPTPHPLTLPLQAVSHEIWETKYRLTDTQGQVVDSTLEHTIDRVARALAEVEASDQIEYWHQQFLWALKNGATPAGRILSNVGAEAFRPATSKINCTVAGTVTDSMDGILTTLHEAGMTLKGGSGIGYEFSTLRPRHSRVSGADAQTSGPLSFMDIYDSMCRTISAAGGRRGAQMATFDVGHPDVLEFVKAKKTDGRLRQFNLSLLITDAFIDAVRSDALWPLALPMQAEEVANLDPGDPEKVLWRDWPITDGYHVDREGKVACRIHQILPARQLWDAIMRASYDYAEPGFILIDHVNRMNNAWFCEDIRATNPCGEQPLPPYGACLLGSINLTAFVRKPFTGDAEFDWEQYRKVVRIFTRMLDNVVEIHGLTLSGQIEELQRKRRHGMGFFGLGSTLTMLRHRYGDAASLSFTERVSRELAICGWQEGLALAREKGPAPIMDEYFTITARMLRHQPMLIKDGYQPGDRVRGAILLARYSRYMQQLAEIQPQLVEALATQGARFTHHSSIAPTGTIALSLGNNASNGIEPSFAHSYVRNVIQQGRKTKEKMTVCSFELLAYRALIDSKASATDRSGTRSLPDYFTTADDISPKEHIDTQAAAQKWIDSSISKTANVPTDFPYSAFKDIYLDACEKGLKGCTTFRFNPERFQGVLVREQDLENTRYAFTLADGSVVECRGAAEIEYDGELHTAANLHDALKEGYYGKL